MAITNLNELFAGLTNGRRTPFTKLVTIVAGFYSSCWTVGSFPVAGAIPTVAAICNDTLTGALGLQPRTGAQDRVLGLAEYAAGVAGASIELEDRLAHMGGLNGTLTTAQTVGVDCSLTASNLLQRLGASDFSEVEWYLETYVALGATVATPTFAVTFNDNTTGVAGIFNPVTVNNSLAASTPAGRRYQIGMPKPIKSIQSCTLSVSTGTAGNFGVTAVRKLATLDTISANKKEIRDYAGLGAPKIFDNSCISFGVLAPAGATIGLIGSIRQAVN